MLAAGGGRRFTACAELCGGLQHPLATAGNRPPGPGRAFLRLHRVGHVCAGYAADNAGRAKGVVGALHTRVDGRAEPALFDVSGGWMDFAGPTE